MAQVSASFIIMHDTETYKYRSTEDRDDERGLMTAIEEFLTSNPEWFMLEYFTNQYWADDSPTNTSLTCERPPPLRRGRRPRAMDKPL